MTIIRRDLIPALRLEEFFTIDPREELSRVHSAAAAEPPPVQLDACRELGVERWIRKHALSFEGEGRNACRLDSTLISSVARALGLQISHKQLEGVNAR